MIHSLGWSGEPAVAAGLLVAAVGYFLGAGRLRRHAGRSRSVPSWRQWCWLAGLAVLAGALLGPLNEMAEMLFSAHMVQHLLLMLVAPPLLVLGAPSRVLLWALPLPQRRALGLWWNRRAALRDLVSTLFRPAVAWTVALLALLLWHVPGWYQAALRHEWIHALEHVSFVATGCLFWWVVLRPDGYRRLHPAGSVLYLFSAGLPGGLLGALLTFAGRPLYPVQSAAASLWGLTPLEDQQLAGLIMWMPGGLIYFGAAAGFFLGWLRRAEGEEAVEKEAVDKEAVDKEAVEKEAVDKEAVEKEAVEKAADTVEGTTASSASVSSAAVSSAAVSSAAVSAASLPSALFIALLFGCGDNKPTQLVPGGRPALGKQAIVAYGCGSCHTIPGVRQARGLVGPPLTSFALRTYIAGEAPNTPDRLIQWIKAPQSIEPGTAMPNLGVTDQQARNIAAFLYTLR